MFLLSHRIFNLKISSTGPLSSGSFWIFHFLTYLKFLTYITWLVASWIFWSWNQMDQLFNLPFASRLVHCSWRWVLRKIHKFIFEIYFESNILAHICAKHIIYVICLEADCFTQLAESGAHGLDSRQVRIGMDSGPNFSVARKIHFGKLLGFH